MLWHRQAIFESKGDMLSSSAESRIRTHQGLRHQIASRLNARWQTDWAIENQAKNLNWTARPYDQRAFSPLDPTAVWHSHLALAIYIFVVNFDALAQASDITHTHIYIYIYIYIYTYLYVILVFLDYAEHVIRDQFQNPRTHTRSYEFISRLNVS